MAQKVRVILLDDLINDGTTEADETIKWSLDGVDYEIDLTTDNAQKLRGRLKEFKQASRVIGGTRPKRTPHRPDNTNPAPNYHQGGVDPAKARAWAIKHGLIPKDQRGRLGKKYKDAYNEHNKFGTTFQLEKLKAELDGTPADAATTPAPAPTLADPVTEFADAITANQPDPGEAEAANHYQPLTHHSPDAQKKKWTARTAHGCPRTDKVEEMTYLERVKAVGGGQSDRNVTILGMLAGIIPLKNGKVSYLSGSCIRLENLEMIRYAPDSDHGWEITPFGRYAHQYHSMG